MSTQNKPTLTSGNPISLTTGEEWTTNWRDWCLEQGIPDEDIVRAFFIPMDDLQTIVETANAGGARAYLALTEPGNTSSIKVVLVATEQNETEAAMGNDIIEPIYPDQPEPEAPYTIYDFTQPCPKFCDINSPLFSNENP